MNRLLMTTCLLALSSLAAAQDPPTIEERLRRLETENRRFEEALRRSEARNALLERQMGELRDETDELRSASLDGILEERINALTEGAQEGWTHATKSGIALRFYGFVRLDAYYNTARMTDPIIPFAVLPEGGSGDHNDDQFAMDSRLTRIGFDFDAGKIGSADTTAKIETDFANFPSGSTESRETPRIRLAYINLDFGDITLRLGQDWDVISPLYPAVHNELLLWGAGNLGDRRPQVQMIWEPASGGSASFVIEASLGMTGAIDGADNDGFGGRTNVDGFDSGHPHGQLRLAVTFDSWVEEARATIGVWGFVSGLETDTAFGGEKHYTPYAVGLDIVLPLFGGVSLRGEVWYGQALSDIRGNMLMDINTATGDEIAGWGGFAELVWQATEEFKITFGASIDNPDNDDLNPGVAGENRELNWLGYVATQYNFGGGLKMGFDVIYWESHWADMGVGNTLRFNWYTQLNF